MQAETTTFTVIGEEEELGEVEAWRVDQLERAGWQPLLADLIAHAREIDLHQACSLARGGCSSPLALSILF